MAPRRRLRIHPQIHDSQEDAGMAQRRSSRLHPQLQANGEGAGATRRRSPRLHPQLQATEEGARVTRRCCSRFRPETHSSEEGAIIRRRRTGTSPEAAAASLPDDDDMLWEILLRLPPQPCSLPRASAVCRRWRGLVTDPKFHRQFCAHHRKPPLLGYFHRSDQGIVLSSVLDPPDRIPPQHFDLGRYSSCNLLDCRHGHILVQDNEEVIVCNLVTRVQRRVAFPLELRSLYLRGAVLCAADHVHGSCHSSPFKVVLMSRQTTGYYTRPLTCVYSSETGLWGNLISTKAPYRISPKPVVLIGNCLYWFSFDGILEFDLANNSLTVIGVDPVTNNIECDTNCEIIEAEDGVVGFAGLSYPQLQLWQRNVNAHGVSTWVPWKTIEMHNIPGPPPQIEEEMAWLLGYDEDTDALFLHASGDIYGVQLKLMRSRKLPEILHADYYYPFKSFYTPGTTIAGEFNGTEMLHDA